MSRAALYRRSDPDMTPVVPPKVADVRRASGENEVETVRLVPCPCCRNGLVPHVEISGTRHFTLWKTCWLCAGLKQVPEQEAADWVALAGVV